MISRIAMILFFIIIGIVSITVALQNGGLNGALDILRIVSAALAFITAGALIAGK